MVDCSWELDCPVWVERVKCSDQSLMSPCLLVASREKGNLIPHNPYIIPVEYISPYSLRTTSKLGQCQQ